MKKFLKTVLLISAFLFLASCVPGDGKATVSHPANFLWGIWHGWVAPFSLLFSIIQKNITIYEVYNTGFWYDLGFYMGILGGFGSLSLSRKKKKERE
ncbi:MAG: hypothetical protein PQJ60_13145 [Spirochaetales bacterium]|nr:hypothetical protein [Spirochaetales bacterium]